MSRTLGFGVLTLVFSFFAANTASFAGQKKIDRHPHLHHALFELREAREELRESKDDFGGHREKAIVAVQDAIKQIDLAIKGSGDNIKNAPLKKDLREQYKKYAHHPHLHHALHELKQAHTELKEAKHEFGGHREAALRDVHHAIHQIELMRKHQKKT